MTVNRLIEMLSEMTEEERERPVEMFVNEHQAPVRCIKTEDKILLMDAAYEG